MTKIGVQKMRFCPGEQKKPHISGRRGSKLEALGIPVLAKALLILVAIVSVLAAIVLQWFK